MKKILITCLTILSVSPVFASIDIPLKYGQNGPQVTELQEFLVDKGYLSYTSGFFGLLTLKAVKTYQISQNLPATGYVGVLTRTAINNELTVDVESSTEAEAQETTIHDPTPVQNSSITNQTVPQPMPEQVVNPINRSFSITASPFVGGASTPIDVYITADDMKPSDVYKVSFQDNTGNTVIQTTDFTKTRHIHYDYVWMPFKGNTMTVSIDGFGSKIINNDGTIQ